jgi:mono/diheme cytochrome c family protein
MLGRLRPLLALALAIALLGAFAAGLAAVFDTPRPRPGGSRAERLFVALCAECHGADGRGSWRATLFLIRPGDLTEPSRTGRESDQYLADVIRHGGAPLGRPGMPAFGATLKDEDIRELVAYLRELARAPGQSP